MNDLTTDALVTAYDPRTVDTALEVRDAVRTRVSEGMAREMGRTVVSPEASGEQRFHLNGLSSRVLMRDWPVQSLDAVELNGSAMDPADFRIEGVSLRRVVYAPSGREQRLAAGEYLFTFTSGYSALTIPPDIQGAATWQTCFELMRVDQRIIGVTQRDPQTGAVDTVDADGWLGSVRRVIATHANRIAV